MRSVFLRVLFCFLTLVVSSPAPGQSLDSLKRVLASETSDEKRIALLKEIGDLLMQERPKEAIAYFEELLRIAQQQKDKLLVCFALNKLGGCWFYLNDFKQSTQYYFGALESTEEKPEFYDLKFRIYNNLGWCFKKFDDFDKALQYFILAEGYARKTGDKDALGMILNNKGVTQKDLRQYDQALASLHASLRLNRETGNKRQERFNLNNISVIYLQQNRTGEAIEGLKQLLVLNGEMRDTIELINNLHNLGNAYTTQADYPNAERSLLLALTYADKKQQAEMKQMVLSELSTMYQKQGKLREAFEYHKAYYSLSDSLKAQETKRYAIELETRYNSVMKERELEKAHKELAEQRLYITWIVGALILALSVSVFFWRTLVLKKRNERRLLELNHEIEAQSEELRQANEEIHAINDNLEKLIVDRTQVIQNQNIRLRQFSFMNAHKIRGPVASILGIMNLLADGRNAHLEKELLQHLHTCTQNLDRIIHEVNRHLENDELLRHEKEEESASGSPR